jgi:hypothetical protein
MNLVGLMPVRNEDWIVGLSARVALMWCDSLVILDHASTDGTGAALQALCEKFPDRVGLMRISDPVWYEMEHREMMLRWARANGRETGATHIAIIDADEILTANLLSGIREHIEQMPYDAMLMLPGYNLCGSMTRYHLNGLWGQRWFSTAFKDIGTVGWRGNGDTFHRREPAGVKWNYWNRPIGQGTGGVLHFWGASERRLTAKHALYQCVETLRWPEKSKEAIRFEYCQWRDGRGGRDSPHGWTFADVPASWIEPYADLMRDHVHLDAEVWQEAEVRRLVAEHGKERFAGLDLFGVA